MAEKRTCVDCNRTLNLKGNFYICNSELFNGHSPLCTPCLKKKINLKQLDTVYRALEMLDIPFLKKYWDIAKGANDVFGEYMRLSNMKQFIGKRWKDSDIEAFKSYLPENTIVSKNGEVELEPIPEELIHKWGEGYTRKEYNQFERKYDLLRPYRQITVMHTEALLNYIRFQVKTEMAIAEGNTKAASDWGRLAKDAAKAAKITPDSLSEADLSDGLDSFSQLVRSVEQAVDIIEILPKFKERPQDKVDFTLWCYINYIRDLQGLPLADYKDVYEFYEKRKAEYEKLEEDMKNEEI